VYLFIVHQLHGQKQAGGDFKRSVSWSTKCRLFVSFFPFAVLTQYV